MFISRRLPLLLLAGASFANSETFRRADVKVAGQIEYGQPAATGRFTGRPKFLAYKFAATPGDRFEASVLSKRGHMEVFLTDSEYQRLAGGSDHFTAEIPAGSKSPAYFLLVTEADRRSAAFTLRVERAVRREAPVAESPAPPDYLACDSDSQCIAVDRAGCCHNGWKDAVNKDKVGDYLAANACKDRHTMCPMYIVKDDRIAMCDTNKHQCVMVKRGSPPAGPVK